MFNRLSLVTEHINTIEDPIKHVVLLMLENHSFDQMLGCFQEKYPELDGIDPTNPRFNVDNKNQKIFQKPITATQIMLDPGHEVANVATQLSDNGSGYIKDFVQKYPKSSEEDKQNVMGYYQRGFLPALHALAEDFTICDKWFCSLPGSTWPNRFFALSGTSSGRVRTPDTWKDKKAIAEIFYQSQKNIFDSLDDAGKSWKTYYCDFPISLVLTRQREIDNLLKYRKIDCFFHDAQGDEADFPAFSFIEPKYMGNDENDDHPPHNTMKAEKFIADIYNALRSNQPLWESTLFIVNYDEHGGFYDHVQPPAAVPPDHHREEHTFDQLGVRVPALLISPWVKRGVEKTVFDHTSLLKYLSDKWDMPPLGERTRQANSIASALDFSQGPRKDCISHIRVAHKDLIPDNPEAEKWDTNSNHAAIHAFADFLQENKGCPVKGKCGSKSSLTTAKFSVGKLLIRCGMWLEKDAHEHHKKRIAHSVEIAESFLTAEQEEKKENESTLTQARRSG